MSTEQSVRLTARGEFGQLQRGLKDLQRDLKDVVGEINRGARKGGLFDESNLRALDLFRNRFEGTMGSINQEFEKQNNTLDRLYQKMDRATTFEKAGIQEQIRLREQELDVIRRQLFELERMYAKRNREAGKFQVNPANPASGGAGSLDDGTKSALSTFTSTFGKAFSTVLKGAGIVAGMAGAGGIMSIAGQAYGLSVQKQTQSLDLAQRMRGSGGWSGPAAGMWERANTTGLQDNMGYKAADSWALLDAYTQRAGALSAGSQFGIQKFSRGYGLDATETGATFGGIKQLGGFVMPKQFADMIGGSVAQSGMLPRIKEVMDAHTGLLQTLNTTFKDGSSSTILAYQTALDRIGTANGMTRLTGQQGANVIGGLGGIYSPGDDKWKWMGIRALQGYNPDKYGNKDLYSLESSFEQGLMNEDNVPAMTKYLKQQSGGNDENFKRFMQSWLQDGGFNITKGEVTELNTATNGFTSFSQSNIDDIKNRNTATDSGAKYDTERSGEKGQNFLQIEAEYELAITRLGDLFSEEVLRFKKIIGETADVISGHGSVDKVKTDIQEFKDWPLIIGSTMVATKVAVWGVKKAIGSIRGRASGASEGGVAEGVPVGPTPEEAIRPTGLTDAQGNPQYRNGNGELINARGQRISPNGQITDPEIGPRTASGPRTAGGVLSKAAPILGPLGNALGVTWVASQVKPIIDNWGKHQDTIKRVTKDDAGRLITTDVANPTNWDQIKNGSLKSYTKGTLPGGFAGEFPQALQKFAENGELSLEGLSSYGKQQLEDLQRQGLLQFIDLKSNGTTTLTSMSDDGKQQLLKLQNDGLISIGGLQKDGTAKITALNDDGKKALDDLNGTGKIAITDFQQEGKAQITSLSKEGADHLLELQKGGSLSLTGMNTETTGAMGDMRTVTSGSMGDIKEEHKGFKQWFSDLWTPFWKGVQNFVSDPWGTITGKNRGDSSVASPDGTGWFSGWSNRVTSAFGAGRGDHKHQGLDIDGQQGDKLGALGAGKVSFLYMDDGGANDSDGVANSRMGGTEMGVTMPDGSAYSYSHMSSVNPMIAKAWFSGNHDIPITPGMSLGSLGGDPGVPGSGYSTTGSHLHLQYWDKNGNLKDPKGLLSAMDFGDSSVATPDGGIFSTEASEALVNSALGSPLGGAVTGGVAAGGTGSESRVSVDVNIHGEGVSQLNGMTLNALEQLVRKFMAEAEAQRLSLQPTTGGWR